MPRVWRADEVGGDYAGGEVVIADVAVEKNDPAGTHEVGEGLFEERFDLGLDTAQKQEAIGGGEVGGGEGGDEQVDAFSAIERSDAGDVSAVLGDAELLAGGDAVGVGGDFDGVGH